MKSIKVLGMKYKLTKKTPEALKLISAEAMAYGMMDSDKREIWVNPRLESEDWWRTFWHEFFHACMRRNGLSYTGIIAPEMEEILVETFANAVYEAIEECGVKLHK